MAQKVMPLTAADGRADYYRGMALELQQLEQHAELCRLALCLGQRYQQKGDRAVISVIDFIVELLCQRLDRLPAESLVDFSNGSLEIGWLFHTLRALGIPGPLHFPYDDFNEFIYRRLVFEHGKDLSLGKGILGKAIYLLSCYQDSRCARCEDKMKVTELRECLVHLVEDIHDCLYRDDLYGRTVALFNPNNEILHLLLFLSRVIDLKLYPEVARRIVKDVLPCVANWICRDSNNTGVPLADVADGSRFRSSFESWELMDFLRVMPAKYQLRDHFVGLPAYYSRDRLCERLVSRLSPGTFINYLNHEAIKLSGIVRLLVQPLYPGI
jgi:hypothetical protein